MDNVARDVIEFVHNTIARVVGIVFVLVGLIMVNAAFVPTDLETGFVLFLGGFCVVLGGYAALNPENVSVGKSSSSTHDDENRRYR